ncbi:class I SAM-dependent methyltransferase [Formicincola oecophyllae]|uniref:Class I SAM-dependent methyltransferase n=1 Tax=Formicincola oecophyllae TaxID=2558361 RepID=A0A4Y6U9X4_9PROT|nr:class I SAM-dependent methyltransferase [Formicincola oecophyllae]QDH13378.1 class I SAM-dependent methyltransferase [Formicincola oecophyllae]
MKGRDSAMPPAAQWERFFQAPEVVCKMVPAEALSSGIAEFGCGYGTFSLPLARLLRAKGGHLVAMDYEEHLVEGLRVQANAHGLGEHLTCLQADLLEAPSPCARGSMAHVMIYNLLHVEHPERLLAEARRLLRPQGTVSVMHWRSDITTPRGPTMAIRPTARQAMAWLQAAGLGDVQTVPLGNSTPWHWGLRATFQR